MTLASKGVARVNRMRARLDQIVEEDDLIKRGVTPASDRSQVQGRRGDLHAMDDAVWPRLVMTNKVVPVGQVVGIGHDVVAAADAARALEAMAARVQVEHRWVVGLGT